ncbi:MAG: putative permease [Bacteroidetes bacterium]|jgi:lipopolysaccharide export system permease protein|nr:putative permease [Bacteroidota bacterium]
MLNIKRLYLYTLQSFVPVFIMTFGICLFIVLMQFLWRYVEDLVGKGIDIFVLGELFSYAALMFIPLALPLAILLASLMTFGSMGENMELLAVKASGVSLLKTMRPLIIFVTIIAIGMFFFQNEAMPRVQTKFYTLLQSIKQKSPELDIPEGIFYNDIENYNLFVKRKDKETKMLHEVMIYSTANGFDNMAVIVSDSAKMLMSVNKDYLKMTLYHGQQFSNFKQSQGGGMMGTAAAGMAPFSRENFKTKEIVIPFDANFNRMNESSLSDSRLSKNISQLESAIDSMRHELDSLNASDKKGILSNFNTFRNQAPERPPVREVKVNDGKVHSQISATKLLKRPSLKNAPPISPDSIVRNLPASLRGSLISTAMSQADATRFSNQAFFKTDTQKKLRSYKVEWYQKFTISLACLIFFFIGAPLGAIIRKGGLGMPVVISVILFIIYYVVNNVGYKLARDGVWDSWSGMLLSSFVLAPLGAFLTYKAMNDSALMNADAYRNFFKRVFGKNDKRNLSVKEVVIYLPDFQKVDAGLESLEKLVGNVLPRFGVRNYIDFWRNPDWERGLEAVSTQLENIVEEMSNTKDEVLMQKVSQFPVLTYQVLPDFRNRKIAILLGVLVVIGLPVYLWVLNKDRRVRKNLQLVLDGSRQLREMLKGDSEGIQQ